MKPIIKNISVIILISLLLLWSLIAGIERLVFFNSAQYPDFFVKSTVTLDSKEKLYKLIDLTCPKGGTDLITRNDVFYLRCGIFWPKSHVTKIVLVKQSSADVIME